MEEFSNNGDNETFQSLNYVEILYCYADNLAKGLLEASRAVKLIHTAGPGKFEFKHFLCTLFNIFKFYTTFKFYTILWDS